LYKDKVEEDIMVISYKYRIVFLSAAFAVAVLLSGCFEGAGARVETETPQAGKAQTQASEAAKLFEGDGYSIRYPIYWDLEESDGAYVLTNTANGLQLAIDMGFQDAMDSQGYDVTSDEGMAEKERNVQNYYGTWLQQKGYEQAGALSSFERLEGDIFVSSGEFAIMPGLRGRCYAIALRNRNILIGFYTSEPESVDPDAAQEEFYKIFGRIE
jgi:hypothetical protein